MTLEMFADVPGDPTSPVIVHVPHSSTFIPDDARSSIVLGDAALRTELAHMTDMHTEHLARSAAGAADLTPWLFVNRTSRLTVDPERFPDEREQMRKVGMGAVYTATSHRERLREPDAARDQHLLDRYFTPYAEALASLTDARLDAVGAAVILDLHSYPERPLPYELNPDDARPAICLGVDDAHTPAVLRDAAAAAFETVGDVAVNEPFSGSYVPLRHYGSDLRVSSLMVEVRRDTFMAEPGGAVHAGAAAVSAGLVRLIERIDTLWVGAH